MPDFILASSSPRRLNLLKQIGIIPTDVIPADIDETPFIGELPKDHAMRLAIEKARKIARDTASSHPDHVVIAGDTVVACGRRILPKGESPEIARECLNLLSGRRHVIYGGICIIYKGQEVARVSETQVHFKHLTTQEIEDYIKTGEWDGKAGGYGMQGHAECFAKRIAGTHSGIIGLCLYNTRQILTGLGVMPRIHNED